MTTKVQPWWNEQIATRATLKTITQCNAAVMAKKNRASNNNNNIVLFWPIDNSIIQNDVNLQRYGAKPRRQQYQRKKAIQNKTLSTGHKHAKSVHSTQKHNSQQQLHTRERLQHRATRLREQIATREFLIQRQTTINSNYIQNQSIHTSTYRTPTINHKNTSRKQLWPRHRQTLALCKRSQNRTRILWCKTANHKEEQELPSRRRETVSLFRTVTEYYTAIMVTSAAERGQQTDVDYRESQNPAAALRTSKHPNTTLVWRDCWQQQRKYKVITIITDVIRPVQQNDR